MRLAGLLEQHWPEYVATEGGFISPAHWRAVEAVLSCRTPRLGGHVHACTDCGTKHYVYHSCNHRACPSCGRREQQLWSAKQQSRRLPVPYYMLTFTVPQQLHMQIRAYPGIHYAALFAASAAAVKELAANSKYLGGETGFISVLHTWTRQMAFHPHVHLLMPAIALVEGGLALQHPKNEAYLFPHQRLANDYRNHYLCLLREKHPKLYADLDLALHTMRWNVNLQKVGRGKAALRYLAAYVRKSAFSEERLLGIDDDGRIRMSWRDSNDGTTKLMHLEPCELIRRWLQHVLPKGFTRVRYYGFLAPAAHRSFRRLRFLLRAIAHPVEIPEEKPMTCPCCNATLHQLRRIQPVRGPPLSTAVLYR